MRKKGFALTSILLTISIMLVIGSVILCQAQEKKGYILGIDPGWPPYQYVDKKGNPTGFDVECTKWIAEKMGFQVEVKPTAWDGIIPSLKAKKIDFIAGMGITKERLEQVDFIEPYKIVGYVVIAPKDSDLNVITALSMGHTIGVLRGSVEPAWIEENLIKKGVNLKLKFYETDVLVIEDLIIGRIAASVMSTPPVYDALKKGRRFKILGPFGMEEVRLAYAVRKGDKELLDILNEGFRKLKKSDKWEELLAKYEIK